MLWDTVWMLQPSQLGILVYVSLGFGAFSEVLDACHKNLTLLKQEVT